MEYTLEYSAEYLQMHEDSITFGQRVGIVDDLLATGETAEATAKLAEKLGGEACFLGFLVELDLLKGREKLRKYDMLSLAHFDS